MYFFSYNYFSGACDSAAESAANLTLINYDQNMYQITNIMWKSVHHFRMYRLETIQDRKGFT